MRDRLFRKTWVLAVIVLFIGAGVAPSINGFVSTTDSQSIANNKKSSYGSEQTEYWALLFAVGVYKNNPRQNRPSMLKAVDDLEEVLLDSPHWQSDHIHKVTASEATGRRLIQELMWLIENEDKDDMSLIYLTTHGSPLKGPGGYPIDLPPRDEDDGADEILVMYEGFDKWYAFIWDDLLNFFLSLLQSKGVCLIVDSCYSGGFNDKPMFYRGKHEEYTVEAFTHGFAEDLATQDRVVLMACEEDEISYGSHFSNYLIDGLWGEADFYGNKNGINSAEEAFDYAKYWVNLMHSFNPTILDLYPGEYTVTYS